MKTFIGPYEARTTDDVLELALGTPLDLWLGVEDETDEERAARLDAARDIIADEPELFDRVTRLAAELLDTATPCRPASRPGARRRAARAGVAA